MKIGRRDCIGTGAALGAGLTTSRDVRALEQAASPPSIPTRAARIERLFKAPDLHPNALEAAADGLWIGDQVSERVFRVDWQSGKVLHEVQTESHNTSALAIGPRYISLPPTRPVHAPPP